jgi:hypothetical protein
MRTCYTCKQAKPLEDFPNRKDKPEGKGYQCCVCNRKEVQEWRKKNPKKHRDMVQTWRKRNPERVATYARIWRARYPDKYRADTLRSNHNMTVAEYDVLHAKQQGKCAICGTTETKGKGGRLFVDHCHELDHIRGLLCHPCNLGIGMFKHDTNLLAKAMEYLAKSKIKC